MRLPLTASILVLSALSAVPASAQAVAADQPSMCPTDLGKNARNAIAAYNDAVTAGDAAKIAAAKAVAQPLAKSDAERCVLAQVDYNAAVKSNNSDLLLTAIDSLAANPVATKTTLSPLMLNAAKVKYGKKDYVGASAILDKLVAAGTASGEALILLADSHFKTGRQAGSAALTMKALAAEKAAGRKAPEAWFKQGVGMAYEAKDPLAVELARDWVAAYPSPKNWTDATRILDQNAALSGNDRIDLYRLKMATHSLSGTADFASYANLASKLGLPGETEAVIKAGIAAGDLQRANSEVASMLTSASGKVAADKAALGAATAKAIASGNAKSTMAYGDANYGYGNYAKAAEAYRAAAGMSGADSATANLRLGMALAMAGDKAGAIAALNAVTGMKAALAKYWLAYLAGGA